MPVNEPGRAAATGATAQVRRRNANQRWRAFTRFMRGKPLGATGLIIVFFGVFVAVAGPSLVPHDPYDVNSNIILKAPNSSYWFGTDTLGRDVFSRTVYGARISMIVGVTGTIMATLAGTIIGVSSGYLGGKFDLVVQRFIDGLTAFPSLLLAIALVAAFGASFYNVILALSITFTPRISRVVRSAALSIQEMPYVDAARVIGASPVRIMMQHVLPNVFAPLLVVATASVGTMIVTEASLSFLGVGIPAKVISWGSMLSGQVLQYFANAPWIGLFPGAALTTVVFGVNVFGDALRDTLDPKLRGR